MMRIESKGFLMSKTKHVLVCALLLLPVVAHSQSKPHAKTPAAQVTAAAKARADADVAARLQAQAVAEAAAKARPLASPAQPLTGRGDVPAGWSGVGSSSAMTATSTATSTPRTAEVTLPAPVEATPVWRAVAPSATLPLSAAAVASPVVQAPVLLSPQAQTPVASSLAPAKPQALEGADQLSQELVIAQQIHQGLLPCEMGASVRVEADAAQPGYFHVQGKGFRYRMYPVRTSTGALRLEDKKAGAVWLQLANKSMLMDQKKGRRMADECAHPEQVAYGQTMKTNPPPSLFDKTGMGRSND